MVSTQLPAKLVWLDRAISAALGINSAKIDPVPWLKALQITIPENLLRHAQDARYLGLLALMVQHDASHAVPAEEKK
jgi:hypothetical protein